MIFSSAQTQKLDQDHTNFKIRHTL